MFDATFNLNVNTNVNSKELQKLIDSLGVLRAEIHRLNKMSLANVQRSAEGLVSTGMSLIDAIKVQTAALESMEKSANKAANGVDGLKVSSEKAKGGVDALKSTAEGFFLEIGAIGARFATQMPSAIAKSVQAFGQQEMAVQKVAAAIRSQGGNVSEVLPIMEQFASDMQQITTYGDEQVLAMQAMATSMGVLPDQMQGVIRSAIGLSSALKMDVMTAVKAASAAVQGKTTALQEYIPALSKCKTEEEKLATVQKLSASGFAQAKAEAETTVGKLKQCANAWGDLAEVAGGTFAPVAVDVANLLKGICEWLSSNQEFTQILVGSLASLAAGFAFSRIGGLASVVRLFKMVGSAIAGTKAASDALNVSLRANPIGLAITAVSAFAMVVSHLSQKERERYQANIEQSSEYRSAIDAEIESLKQWGITLEGNKRRTAEVAAEIAKLKAEEAKYRNDSGTVNAAYGGATYKTYSLEEQVQLDNYRVKIESLEKLLKELAPAEGLAATATKQHAAAVERSNAILAESEEKLRAATDGTEALRQIRQKYADTEREIADIEAAFGDGSVKDSERVAKANRLAQARREIMELGKAEAEQVLKNGENERTAELLQLLSRKLSLETQIAAAKNRGDSQAEKSLNDSLSIVSQDLRRVELAQKYIDSLKGTVKSEEDYADLKKRAYASANMTLVAERKTAAEAAKKSDAEKWLAAETAASKTRQQGLEMDILRARASGNETLAKELEGSQRVAQLASEIFENARREGMSRDELVNLQNSANAQARERYNLEKSITDEAERQNLAKDAQAKIEDIILANKIEQLKAQGRMKEAQALAEERDIKRSLAGLQGVSDEDKKKLAATMRQTNVYRTARQRGSAGAGGAGYESGGSFGGGTGGSSGNNRKRPATVSAKYADLYDQWKAAGGSKSGQSWTAFRDANKGEAEDRKAGRQSAAAKRLSGQAQNYLGGAESAARKMAGAVPKGISKTADEAQNASPSRSNRQKQTTQPQTADAALGRELQKRGTDGDKGGDPKKDTDNIEKMAKALDDCLQSLKDIKNNTAATATKKESK